MSSNYLSTPKFRACSSTTGLPLVGYYLYTYSPATVTPKATYPTVADMLASTNANTNPVVLDSNGEAVLVLKGTTKIVLKDTLGNVIWTQDNVEANTVQLDANGNELIKYSATASAVNELTISNNATGLSPSITATGDDTNIGINFVPKGTGTVNITNIGLSDSVTINGTLVKAGDLKLYEQTTNGTNYVGIKAPAALAADLMFTLPAVDGSSGYYLKTDGSKVLSFADPAALTSPAASDSVAGILKVAVQSDMEATSSTILAVTPGRQKFHPSAAKAWLIADTNGGINLSFGIASISDVGTGRLGITYSTAFSSTVYVGVATVEVSSANEWCTQWLGRLAGSIELQATRAGTLTDPSQYHAVFFGDL